MISGRMVLSKINGLRKTLAEPCIPIGIMMVNFSKKGIPFTPVVLICHKQWSCRVLDQWQRPAVLGGERANREPLNGGG